MAATTAPMVVVASIFSALLFLQGAETTTFYVKNNCPYPVWPATLGSPPLPGTGFLLNPGGSASVAAPPKWSGRLWGRAQCSISGGSFSCASGDCGTGQVECHGAGGVPPATLVEFTLGGYGGNDFYDVSNVDGFNLPVGVRAKGGSGRCGNPSCPADINARCPEQLQVKGVDGRVVACKSACLAFNTDAYCCRGSYGTPDACPPSEYSKMFKSACPKAYSYAYDDASSTFTCAGADYHITFCP
uniref:Thaumatin-like protein 1a n=1 Tax=Anthurium amnicola TaxID=1678845 RepID=A0A1D1ZDM1_9ARAE